MPEEGKTARFLLLTHLCFSLLIDISKGINEWMLAPINTAEFHALHQIIQYFSVRIMLLASMIMLLILYYVYEHEPVCESGFGF